MRTANSNRSHSLFGLPLVLLILIPILMSCGGATTSEVLSFPPPPPDEPDPPEPPTPGEFAFEYPSVPELHTGTRMGSVRPKVDEGDAVTFADVSAQGAGVEDYGLEFDPATGGIGGTPTREATSGVTFTIEGTRGDDVAQALLSVVILPPGSFPSLRWGAEQGYGEIPQAILDIQRPNDLSSSGQTYVKTGHDGSAVAGVEEIGTVTPHADLGVEAVPTYANGGRDHYVLIQGDALSTGFVCTDDDTEYILTGDMTVPGYGIRIAHRVRRVTINLNGHTIRYMTEGCTDPEIGTVTSWTEVAAGRETRFDICLYVDDLSDMEQGGYEDHMILFLSGNEEGYLYPVTRFEEDFTGHSSYPVTSVGDVLRLGLGSGDIHFSSVEQIDWRNGGPEEGDTFRIFDPQSTYGVGAHGAEAIDDVWIVNGSIIQGDGWGGANGATGENHGCAPISNSRALADGIRYIGGIYAEWQSECTQGFDIGGGGGSGAGEGTYCEYCTLKDAGDWIWSRFSKHRSIWLPQNSYVGHVRIMQSRQTCIEARSKNGIGNTVVEYVEANQESSYENGTMIGFLDSQKNTVRYCNCYAWGELPHCFAIHSIVGDNEIHDCWGEVSCYGWDRGRNGTGFSNRWTGNKNLGEERPGPNFFHDNVIIGWGQSDYDVYEEEQTVRVLWPASFNEGDLVLESMRDNIVAAISNDGTRALCVSTGGTLEKTNGDKNVVIAGGHFFSNYGFGVFGDYGYRQGNGWDRFVGVTFHKVGNEDYFHSFQTIDKCQVELISSSFPNGGGVEDWSWGQNDWLREVRIGYRVKVTVERTNGTPVEGASIVLRDKDGNVLRDGTYYNPNDGDGDTLGYVTDENGEVTVDAPVRILTNEDALDQDPVSKTLCPLTFYASKGSLPGSSQIQVAPTGDTTITVTVE